MRFFLGRDRDYWVSPYRVLATIFFWKEIDYNDGTIARWRDWLYPWCVWLQETLQEWFPRRIECRVETHDLYNAYETIAHFNLCVLRRFREENNGCPVLDPEDRLDRGGQSIHGSETTLVLSLDDENEDDEDWARILDEMIWAFETIVSREDYENARVRNALRLFTKYYFYLSL